MGLINDQTTIVAQLSVISQLIKDYRVEFEHYFCSRGYFLMSRGGIINKVSNFLFHLKSNSFCYCPSGQSTRLCDKNRQYFATFVKHMEVLAHHLWKLGWFPWSCLSFKDYQVLAIKQSKYFLFSACDWKIASQLLLGNNKGLQKILELDRRRFIF